MPHLFLILREMGYQFQHAISINLFIVLVTL